MIASAAGEAPDLELILERIGPGNAASSFRLWACRGVRKGCAKKLRRQRHCPDCLETHDQERLGQVLERVYRGEA